LFRHLVEETGLTNEEEEAVYEGFRLVVDNEVKFIDNIFNGYKLFTIDAEELKSYIKNRANERLCQLGLAQIFKLSTNELTQAKSIAAWFDPTIRGASSNDFFAQSRDGSNYSSKISQNFMSVDLTSLDLVLT
jgi:ribonucleotide reductase beta subunit family protein with ferritin-like domain